jgi:uncharacterized protein YdhG (YjbR/CyaY superfamily)
MNPGSVPPNTMDAYIEGFSRDVQEILQKIRGIVKEATPEAEDAIKYQIPTLVLNANLAHFAAFERHIGSYRQRPGLSTHSSTEFSAQQCESPVQADTCEAMNFTSCVVQSFRKLPMSWQQSIRIASLRSVSLRISARGSRSMMPSN